MALGLNSIMADFFEAASSVLRTAEARLETAAQNVSNMSTPGYRRRSVSFSEALALGTLESASQVDLSAGKLNRTGGPLDLALVGDGAFVVRSPEGTLYTRNGQFECDADGRVVDTHGRALQMDGGGDLTLTPGSAFEIHADGVVTQDNSAIGRIAMIDFADPARVTSAAGGGLQTPDDNVSAATAAQVRQGYLESSNVSLGQEMVEVMQTVRTAGGSQRLINVYDELLGRAITTFGQSS